MKKVTALDKSGRNWSPKQRDLLALLEELRQSNSRQDLTFWKKFDRDLKANRLTSRQPANG